jgi:DNA polymerase-3 subunit delta'
MTTNEPGHNPHLIGHDEAMRQVAEAFAAGRMHHAWLITGIEGVGKATLAHHIAHHLLSNGQNPIGKLDLNHKVAKLVTAGTHPDMVTIARARDEKTGELRSVIVVEDALKVATFLRKTSTHGGWRVVIVDEAHMLNRFGQNAILKILEEPPPRVVIILTVTTAGALLPTIRSRCRLLPLAPLSPAAMTAILSKTSGVENTAINRLIELSNGSIGFALKMLQTEAVTLYDELINILTASPPDLQRLHRLADQISRKADTQSYDVVITLFQDHMRRQARHAAVTSGGIRLLQILDKVNEILAQADTSSLDRKLAFINAISAMRAA